jgi:tRNA A-37 threonylcarbamoyl transferase component Bud32
MTPERWQQIDRVWQAVLARPAPERAAALAELAQGDETLRRDVESLLFHLTRASVAGFGAAPLHVAVSRGSLLNRHFGTYTVRALLGVGGMGEVYRAHDATLGRDVAIKILPEPWLTDPDRRARFEQEARLLASLNHPNVGAIYGAHDWEGVRGLVLELVDGETLAERIEQQTVRSQSRRGLPIDDVVAIARQLTAALEAAHERGIVHCDLKPANIKITPDGRVKVLDFGLARAVTGLESHPEITHSPDLAATEVSLLLGTAAYMSPEQARGRTVDKRTDIWAFGCVLYEMLTGTQAFGGLDVGETLRNVINADANLSAVPPDTPPALRMCLRRCLQKDPEQRIRDIGDVRLAIEGAFDLQGADSRPRGFAGVHMRRAYAGWVVAGVVAVGAGTLWLDSLRRSAANAPAPLAATTPPVLVKPKIGGGGTAMTRTIQEAINLAVRGATVSVLPGTYTEALVIKRGLTLEATGERSGAVVVAPAGTPETVIEIATTEPVIIRGLTIHAPGGTAIRGNGEVDLTVERTKVLAANPPPDVRALIVVSNDVRKSGARAKAAIRQNVIDGAVAALPRGVARPQNHAVKFAGDVDAVLDANIIRRTGAICIVVDPRDDFGGHTNVDILNNDIDECHPAGRVSAIKVGSPAVGLLSPRVPVTVTGTVNVIGNTIRNSSRDCLNSAIAYDAFSGRIERNRIVDFVQGCASANPRNLPAAIWLGLRPAIAVPAAAPVVRFNDIQGNAQAGLRIAPNQKMSADVSCNYWGSPNGPSGIGSGDGDAIVVEPGAPAPRFLPFAKAPIAQTPSPRC